MKRVLNDLHRMVDYIPDLRKMMMIGLDLFIIIGILILIIGLAILTIIGILILIIGLAVFTIIGILILIIGLALLTIIKILIFIFLKRRNGKQERLGPQTPSPIPSENVKSEQNRPKTLIMNDDHTCSPLLDIPMPTTPTSMPLYSDPTAATHGTPPLKTSVSVAATPSISSLINSKDPCMIKARVFVGNLNASRDSREMLCNENSPILYDRVLVNDFPQLDLIVIYYVTIGIIALIFIQLTAVGAPMPGGGSSTMTAVGGAPMGSSTMTAVGAPMGGGGASTMTAIGNAPRGASTMTAVGAPMPGGGSSTMTAVGGAPMGGGGSSTMTAVGGAGGGGAPSASNNNTITAITLYNKNISATQNNNQ